MTAHNNSNLGGSIKMKVEYYALVEYLFSERTANAKQEETMLNTA